MRLQVSTRDSFEVIWLKKLMFKILDLGRHKNNSTNDPYGLIWAKLDFRKAGEMPKLLSSDIGAGYTSSYLVN